PYGDRADWSAANTISKDELPLIRPILDRFPLIRNFNKETDPDKAEEFAREKARRRKLKDGNYQFLVKAALTMRHLNQSKNIEFSREVDEIIIPQLYRRMITSDIFFVVNVMLCCEVLTMHSLTHVYFTHR
ncbi:MAG: hypothetical protein WA631_19010, partial [Nitrososphaeraceae archaeon]